jgi:hypothetical protein
MTERSDQDKKALVYKLLQGEAAVFIIGGLFLLLKNQFMDLVLIDPIMDLRLGGVALCLGVANIVISEKFFKPERKI